jgi:peptide/nickel transport system substrate-binding protein
LRLSVATVAAATLLLTACVSADPGTEQPTGDRVAGGEITVVVSQDALPGSVLGSFANNWPWSMAVFETAIRVDPATQEVSPLLATDWTVADDGLSIDMNFRDDVTFHTGRAMTAEDVKFSYDSAADPEFAAQLGFIARQFASVNATGDTSVTIEFNNPIPNLNEFLAEIPIIDSETVSGLGDGTQVVGTGPYIFAEWNPGASFRLERFEDYRDADYASLDEINYEVIANSTAAVSAARTGRADIVYGLTTTDTQSFATDADFAILDAGGVIYPVGMDVTVAPFDDVRVRQAVLHAIDRERINDQVFQGTGTLTNLFWGPSTPGYSEELANTYEYDPERARELLDEAGVGEINVEVVFMATPIQTSRYEIFANSMAAIGINTTAVQLDPPTYIQRQSDGDLGTIFLAQHGQVGRGPVTMLSSLPTLREGNPSQFWNAEYESLRNDLILAADADASREALEALSQYMIDEAFIASSIQAPQQILVSSALQGIEIGPFGELFAETLFLTGG